MVQTYNTNFGWGGTPNMFDSRDQVEEWLRYQHVKMTHQRQRKPKSIDHFRPVRPLHSISIDLIDYTKNGSSYTNPAGGRIAAFINKNPEKDFYLLSLHLCVRPFGTQQRNDG